MYLVKAAVQKTSYQEDDTWVLSQGAVSELELILESFLLTLRGRRKSKKYFRS